MIQSIFNNLIIKIESKFVEHFYHMIRASNITRGSNINPADYVNIIGRIISLPKKISNKLYYNGFTTKDMQEGDDVIFRYDVIFDFEEQIDGTSKFRNLFMYKDKEYWVVDIQKVFAVIRNREIIMVNGYCMLENIKLSSKIILPPYLKKNVNASSATLTQIGNNLSHLNKININPGAEVFYNPMIAQEYKIKDKKFAIIRQKDILGINNIE